MLYKILYRVNGHWVYEGTVYKLYGNDLRVAYIHAIETARQIGDGRWHVEFI